MIKDRAGTEISRRPKCLMWRSCYFSFLLRTARRTGHLSAFGRQPRQPANTEQSLGPKRNLQHRRVVTPEHIAHIDTSAQPNPPAMRIVDSRSVSNRQEGDRIFSFVLTLLDKPMFGSYRKSPSLFLRSRWTHFKGVTLNSRERQPRHSGGNLVHLFHAIGS